MIVKNETHVIERCLRSIAPYIDRYDITDTGSDDGTPEKIKEIMDELGIPGEVYLSDWKGFGDHGSQIGSRTEALRNCDGKADYAWMIDADDSVDGNFKLPEEMNFDVYSLKIHRGDFTWWRNQIFRTGIGWRYVGILHEYAACEKEGITGSRIEGDYFIEARTEGARNLNVTPTEKYSRDAETLKKALEEEPENHRYMFYLAQSYFDSQQWEKSYEAYKVRAEAGGWEEEAFYSYYRMAICLSIMEKPLSEQIFAYQKAYDYRPIRAEPLVQMSRILRMNNMPRMAYVYAKQACSIPYPKHDILFLADDVYSWMGLDELGATAFYAHDFQTGYYACQKLISENKFPTSERERIYSNLKQYEMKLVEIQKNQQEQARRQAEMEKVKEQERQKKIKNLNNKKKKRVKAKK